MKKIFAVLAAIFLLAVMACSGGGGEGGSSSNENKVNLKIFKGFWYGTAASGSQMSYNLTGSDTLGNNWNVYETIVSDGTTIFEDNNVTKRRSILSVTSPTVLTSTSTDYYLASNGAFLKTVRSSGIISLPSKQNSHIPDYANVGDSGKLPDVIDSDGTSRSSTWKLEHDSNGNYIFVVSSVHKNASNVIEGQEDDSFYLDFFGNPYKYSVTLKYSDRTITMSGNINVVTAPATEITPEQIANIESSSQNITNKIQASSNSTISTILEQARATALEQPSVESAEIIDGNLSVKYKNAGYEVWVLDTPEFNTPDHISATYKSNIVERLNSIAPLSTKGSTAKPKAALINALAKDSYCQKATDEINKIKTLLESKGYDVLMLDGLESHGEASPEEMKNLSDYSIIIMLGHGCRANVDQLLKIQYGAYGVQTGLEVKDENYWMTHLTDWVKNRYFIMNVPWGEERKNKKFIALTGQFWKDAYANSHFNNALFMNLACSGAKDENYYEDLFSVGVSAYTGWTNVTSVSPWTAETMLISMLNGSTFEEAYQGLSSDQKSQSLKNSFNENVISNLYRGPTSGYFLKLQTNSSTISKPDLIPYKSAGWSDKIIVSTNTGDNIDDTPLTSDSYLYFDLAYINDSNTNITQDYVTKLYVDGLLTATFNGCNPLQATYYCYHNDFLLGKLPAGTHNIKMVVDANNQIAESNESDNEYIKTITVTSPGDTSGDYTSPNIGTLKYVPAGSFQRDSDPANISTVSAFRMSKYEITRAQYLAIMGTDPSDTDYSSRISDPVQMVTWYDALEFCNKLSIAEGLTPVYTITGRTPATGYPITNATVVAAWANNGYRLPTEMEWMWAAMGATSGYGYTGGVYTTGYLKAFAGSTGSNAIGDYAWTWENSSVNEKSQPVGTKLPNELGLYDMSGNALEWCWDWYADNGMDPYYAISGTVTNYRGAASGAFRVIRGGSWTRYASYATVAERDGYGPKYQGQSIGIRVVRP